MSSTHPYSLHNAAPAHAWVRYGIAVVACLLVTGVASLLAPRFDLANIVMLFLLAVVGVTIAAGRGAGIAASFLSVALFDFFFVPPKLSFGIADAQYLLTFGVMLVVALVTSHLMSHLQRQSIVAAQRELRVRALYELSRELAGTLAIAQVSAAITRFLDPIGGKAVLITVGRDGAPLECSSDEAPTAFRPDALLVESVLRTGGYAAFNGLGYFPVASGPRVRGVLAVTFAGGMERIADHRQSIEAIASLAAIVVERLHYVDVAAAHALDAQAERLRSSILSALSHDIRSPLTVLTGLADALSLSEPPLAPQQKELAAMICAQAARLNGLASNILDMARLSAGPVRLRREWQPLEEVVGTSLAQLDAILAGHAVEVHLAADLPLLELDAVLVERVLCNLIENAVKHSPAGGAIELSAVEVGSFVAVTVRDHGPGIPAADKERVFEAFVRGSTRTGMGLGLAICRAIVTAHGGGIGVTHAPGGGASVTFTLPKGSPPAFDGSEPDAPRP